MKPIRILEGQKGIRGEGDQEAVSPLLPFSSSPLLVRPLLTWAKRLDTEGYCVDSSVEYRYDTMNEDTAFKRVRIRKILLPLLEDFNPNIVEILAQTASLMQGQPAMETKPADLVQPETLTLKDLKLLSSVELYDAVRAWLTVKRGNTRGLQLKHIQAIERLLLSNKSGREVELPGGAKVVKRGGKLVYQENLVEN